MLFENSGWLIPPCIRKLLWADIGKSTGLEALRITVHWYSYINASEYEIWHQIQSWARRNAYKNHNKLRSIATFAIENPSFADCEHKLLQRCCPAGKCFIAELRDLNKEPLLFKK